MKTLYRLVMASICACMSGTVYSQTINLPANTIGTLTSLRISYSGASGVAQSWIGLYRVGAGDGDYLTYQYINDNKNGTLTFAGREETGLFNFRLFSGNGYLRIAVSSSFLIRQGMILDTSFASGGIFRREFLLNSLDDWATDVKVMDDGRIVVAGTAQTVTTDHPTGYEANEIILARFTSQGQLDQSFGQGGYVHTALPSITAMRPGVKMLVQPDAKIIVAGSVVRSYNGVWEFLLVRYDSKGVLDPGFGSDGFVITNFTMPGEPPRYSWDVLRCIELLPDGRILAGGGSLLDAPYSPGRLAIARYTSNGSLDTTFGTGGKITPKQPVNFRGWVEGFATSSSGGDGSLIAGVTAEAQFGMNHHQFAKFKQNGRIDSTFGTSGFVDENHPGYNNAQYMRTLRWGPDGSLMSLGGSDIWGFWLMKRSPSDGTPMTAFGDTGFVYCDPTYGWDIPAGMVFTNDGKIVVGLTAYSNWWSAARFNQSGTMDIGFGVSYFRLQEAGNDVQSSVNSIARQSDGKIILVGAAKSSSTKWDFVVMRFVENPQVYTTEVEDQSDNTVHTYSLLQNYPNPFNQSTIIRYSLSHRARVSLAVFNTLGQRVTQLVSGEEEAGPHEADFRADELASGVYFYRIVANGFVQTKKLVLMK